MNNPFDHAHIQEEKAEREARRLKLRTNLLIALFCGVLGGFCLVLYQLQVVQGASFRAGTNSHITDSQQVESIRGEILDRYGRVLVTNELSYNVELDWNAMEPDQRLDILARLLEVCREEGVEWADTLPITKTAPWRYTAADPLSYQVTDEEGQVTDVSTSLGALAEKWAIGWVKDAALARRFQPVFVSEPTVEDTVSILRGLKEKYEQHHGVRIQDSALVAAATLSNRYITDRFLPDKAIDLIDEACSDMNLKDAGINRRQEISRELADYGKERELLEAAEEPNFERMAEIKSRELQLQTELDGLAAQGEPQLTMDNLARVIELWTKIPASKIREEEFKRLSELDQRLKKKVVGQDKAIDAVSAAIRRSRVGISPKHKPVSFIFVGSTGVGKTELVKQLADDLFNAPESLIRLDMSEFMEKHSVSRIIGSPPGYVGYDEAGQLTEKIRRKPYSVVLFDEIEKAHPDVLNVLLQILDDGQITDAHGRKVNFENTVIVMTSNAGSDRKEGTVGFNKSASELDQDRAMKALRQFLRPEFINRVDEIVCFNKLSEEDFRPIARLMLDELKASMKEKGLTLAYDEELVKHLVKKSYSAAYGARNLRRTIQKEIEDALALEIINSYDHPVSQIAVTAEEDRVVIRAL